jgi:alkylhydroperoxidase family enzyme
VARIAYFDAGDDPEIAALAEQIKKERGGKLHNLYRMLLNSPPIARGWLTLLSAVRQQCQLNGKYRELSIMRVAVLNGADYEYRGHVPFARKEGMSQAQIDAVADWQGSTLYSEAERAVLAYTDSMTREIHVPDAVFAEVAKHFDKRGITELTATIAAYNLVSRFLEALQIDHETD